MAVSGASLLAVNGGEADPALTGDTEATLTIKLNAWIAAALAITGGTDASATEYAYVRFYKAAIVARTADPSSSSLRTGESESFTGDQLDALWRLMEGHQQALDALLPTATPGTATALLGSRAVRHQIEW